MKQKTLIKVLKDIKAKSAKDYESIIAKIKLVAGGHSISTLDEEHPKKPPIHS